MLNVFKFFGDSPQNFEELNELSEVYGTVFGFIKKLISNSVREGVSLALADVLSKMK